MIFSPNSQKGLSNFDSWITILGLIYLGPTILEEDLLVQYKEKEDVLLGVESQYTPLSG